MRALGPGHLQTREIPLGRTLGDVAVRVEMGAVALADKGLVVLCPHFAALVSADRGQDEKLLVPVDNEEALLAELIMDALGLEVAQRAGIDHLFFGL